MWFSSLLSVSICLGEYICTQKKCEKKGLWNCIFDWIVLHADDVSDSAVLVSINIKVDTTQQVQSLAVISNEDAQVLWSIDVLANDIRVKVTSFVPNLPNNDYQLWIVPASGAAPISIGVMQQSGEFYLSKPVEFDNIDIAALAVSKEPKGGSPNGAPTDVLYAVELAFI